MTASVHEGDCRKQIAPSVKEMIIRAGKDSRKCWDCSVCCFTTSMVNGVRKSKEYAMMGRDASVMKDKSGVDGKLS